MSIGEKKYGLVTVDDFSRFSSVLFLSHKDYSYEALKIFCNHVQNEKRF